MSMFCYQCQEAAQGTGCKVQGVCGKNEQVAKLQDLLIYAIKGLSQVVIKGKVDVNEIPEENHQTLTSLFMTITNANFDEEAFVKQINKVIKLRDDLRKRSVFECACKSACDVVDFQVKNKEEMLDRKSVV